MRRSQGAAASPYGDQKPWRLVCVAREAARMMTVIEDDYVTGKLAATGAGKSGTLRGKAATGAAGPCTGRG
eukprot:scaffold42613_cov42-Phaeocystis_antarctica.AAC.3